MTPDRVLELLGSAPPVVFPIMHPALCALPAAVREAELHVLFGGEAADEVCGSHFTLPDWATHTSLLQLIVDVLRRDLPYGFGDLRRWAKQRALRLRRKVATPYDGALLELARPEIHEEYAEWVERQRKRAAADTRPLRYLALLLEDEGFLAMNWEAASSLGVRRVFPFFTREVLELAFSCHPRELIGPGTKRLLRAALRDDVPPGNLNRPDRGWTGAPAFPERRWDEDLPHAAATFVRPEWWPRPRHPVGFGDCFALKLVIRFTRTFEGMSSANALR